MKAARLPKIAVLIPCYNEELTIAEVVRGFRASVPDAEIYVYDNNSTDNTIAVARQAGAIVRSERGQGKGRVVRRMFADIEADVYVMVDGDATYDAPSAPRLIASILDGNDMVNAARESQAREAYRRGHKFGNWLLTSLVATIFGSRTTDMLSGYKAFSRRFVKTFPAISKGFEIETELMIHALELNVSIDEIKAPYGERPEGSVSKLSTFKDAFRILRLIGFFVKNERPIAFFTAISAILLAVATILMVPVMKDYFATGLVPRFPSLIFASGLTMIAVLSFFAGLILDNQTLGRREAKRIAYLQLPASRSVED